MRSRQIGASYYAVPCRYDVPANKTFSANTHYSFTNRSEFIFLDRNFETNVAYEKYKAISLPASATNSFTERFQLFSGGSSGSGIVFMGAVVKVYLHIKVYGIL